MTCFIYFYSASLVELIKFEYTYIYIADCVAAILHLMTVISMHFFINSNECLSVTQGMKGEELSGLLYVSFDAKSKTLTVLMIVQGAFCTKQAVHCEPSCSTVLTYE